jgi:hypothetical protein
MNFLTIKKTRVKVHDIIYFKSGDIVVVQGKIETRGYFV